MWRAIISSSSVGIDIDGDAAVRPRDQRSARRVGGRIELDAEPGQLLGDARPHGRRVLADAGREHEGVEPAERRRQHAGVEADAIDEIVERERGPRIGARLELAHVVADAGQALQAALVVEQLLHRGGAHALLIDQIEHDAGIDLAGPRAHRQAVERGEAHRALDAAARRQRAHRGAAAEMRDDHAPARDRRRDLRQALRDVFVGKAVEAVAAHAFGVEALRDRVVVGKRAVAAMKGGVEAGDLRQIRKARADRADRRQVVGLMQRRERNVALESRKHVVVDQDRPIVVRAAMDDAMADRDRDRGFCVSRSQAPTFCIAAGRSGTSSAPIGLVDQRRAVGPARRAGAGASPMPSIWPLIRRLSSLGARGPEHLELDARRAGIDDEDRVHGGHAAGSAAMRRRASA